MAKTALMFPGQGAQAVGMGRDLVEVSEHAAAVFRQADEILGFELSKLCFSGPAERLEATDIQQPAILVTSVALWAALTEGGRRDIAFDMAAGLSLGEYTALHVAGALSFPQALQLVHCRGRYMQQAAGQVPSGMVSIIGLQADAVEDICRQAADGQVLGPANFNCPGQIVISGEQAACARAAELVESAGTGKAVALKVAGAFHSALMKPAAEQLKQDLQRTEFSVPHKPVISNVDAQSHGSPQEIRDALYRQVFSPVRWQESIETMITQGVVEFVEIGPGRVLTGLMRKINRTVKAVNLSTAQALTQFAAT